MQNIANRIYDTNPEQFFKWAKSEKFDPNICIHPGMPLWIDCLKHCHTQGMLYLLENGANMKAGFHILKTLNLTGLFLNILCSYTDKSLLIRAIKEGIDLNVLIPLGQQPTFYYDHELNTDKIIVKNVEKPLISLVATDSDMRDHEIIEILELLITNGADINLCDTEGNTVLFDAAVAMFSNKNIELPILSYLISHGSNKQVLNNIGLTAEEYYIHFVRSTLPNLKDSEIYQDVLARLK